MVLRDAIEDNVSEFFAVCDRAVAQGIVTLRFSMSLWFEENERYDLQLCCGSRNFNVTISYLRLRLAANASKAAIVTL